MPTKKIIVIAGISFLLLMSIKTKTNDVDVISMSKISNVLSFNSEDIVLIGEEHSIKSLPVVYEQINAFLDKKKIDTIFYEFPYSNYVSFIVKNSNRYVGDEYQSLIDNNNFIYHIDIEDDLPTFMAAVQRVLIVNDLKESLIYLKSRNIIQEYYRQGSVFTNKTGMLEFIDELERNIVPSLRLYKHELSTLLIRIRDSVNSNLADSGVERDEVQMKVRDSLMTTYVVDYVNEHKVKKWCGFFGCYHIASRSDEYLNDKVNVDINFYNQLLSKDLNLKSHMIARVNLINYNKMYSYRSNVELIFSNKYYPYENLINKNQCVYFYKKNVNWFLFKK